MNAPAKILRFGATAVPWTVSWSGEEGMFIDNCRFFDRRMAICQVRDPGNGRPLFGKPHMDRQREAIAKCLCDLCGKPLKHSTKVSLSHASPQPHGAAGWAILQVEPLLHKACAAESLRWRPSLKRDIENETLRIRQVTRWRAQVAIMDEVYVETVTGAQVKALGHGKVELLTWTDCDLAWLEAS